METVQTFASQFGLASPFLMDATGEIGRLYQLRGTPTTFFINADGIVQNIQPGFIYLSWIESNLDSSS